MRFSTPLLPIAAIFFSAHVAAGFVDARTPLPPQSEVQQPRIEEQPIVAPLPVNQFLLKPPETVRSAVDRWAKQAGWTFGPEHYIVPVDIPVVGTFAMPSDFKAAIRVLLDSTDLGDTPVQPCFYSNQVIRVVLRQERCDRL